MELFACDARRGNSDGAFAFLSRMKRIKPNLVTITGLLPTHGMIASLHRGICIQNVAARKMP
ncbi:conserved hypothetical protein [Ricinus communis]|uniref:Pentatricopeptide repeat-containing protein n=1 Tax=Ricinus communis TaxID=3988 RepID=B9SUH0_RICCO|nr:conserved hypothetical protein [Ricinus communis]